MNQEYVRHPTINNYEASRDSIVRHCEKRKRVGTVDKSNTGNLRFSVGKNRYISHRFVYAIYNGETPKGLVIDHIDGNKCNNNLNNLQAVTQSENFSSVIQVGVKQLQEEL